MLKTTTPLSELYDLLKYEIDQPFRSWMFTKMRDSTATIDTILKSIGNSDFSVSWIELILKKTGKNLDRKLMARFIGAVCSFPEIAFDVLTNKEIFLFEENKTALEQVILNTPIEANKVPDDDILDLKEEDIIEPFDSEEE